MSEQSEIYSDKHVRNCLMSDCYFHLCYIHVHIARIKAKYKEAPEV